MNFKVVRGNGVQQAALQSRLEALGLKVDEDRQLTAESVEKLGGAEALKQIASKKGELDLQKLEGLRPFWDKIRPSRIGAWLHFKSVGMSTSGLTGAVKNAIKNLDDPDAIAAVGRRADHLLGQLPALTEDRTLLLRAPVGAIKSLSKDLSALSRTSSKLLKKLSEKREAALEDLKTAHQTLGDKSASAEAKAAAQKTIDNTNLDHFGPAIAMVMSVFKASDLVASNTLGTTLKHHLGSHLETRLPTTDEERGQVLNIAVKRTEAVFATQLTQAEVSAMLEQGTERLKDADAQQIQAVAKASTSWAKADVPDAAQAMDQAVKNPVSLSDKLATLLDAPKADADAIITEFEKLPGLRDLFCEWSGVNEGYSIRAHTEMVYEQLDDQWDKWGMGEVNAGPNVNLRRLFNGLVALHDIGKPVAIEEGDKDRQHEFTTPILLNVMPKLGFTKEEVALARELMDNDLLGDIIKQDGKKSGKKIGTDEAFEKIKGMGEKVGMSPKDYFKLQSFFYVMDASSYPFLMRIVFGGKKEGKTLVPTAKSYKALGERCGVN